MHAKFYIHNLCIFCAWLFIPHGFITKVASSCTRYIVLMDCWYTYLQFRMPSLPIASLDYKNR